MQIAKQLVSLWETIKSSTDYKRILKNFGFLSVIQIANYLLPLISLPYLINVLGPERFGHIMFAQAFVQYFVTIVDFGFNFSATKDITLNKEKSENVSEIFCSVMILKAALLCISFAAFCIIVFVIDRFSSHRIIYFLSFGTVIGNMLFPSWFFQGIEKMQYITFVNLLSKIISTICIFVFIKTPDHFLTVPTIFSLSFLLPSLLSLFYVRKIFPITLIFPSSTTLLHNFNKGIFIFLSSISSSLYSISNTFILGLLFNNMYAGYYSFAEKIIRACTSLLTPLNNALFPYMSLKMKDSPKEGMKIFQTILIILVTITTIGTIVIYGASNLLVTIVDADFYPSVTILRMLSPLLFIVTISNLIGFQILYTTGQEKRFLTIVFIAGLINVISCILLSPKIEYKAAAVSLVVSEAFIALSFLLTFRKLLVENK